MSVAAFKGFIKDRLGLHFGPDADERLGRLLRERLAVFELESITDYLGRVAAEPTEFQALARQLTVGETYFYREPQHLGLLTERLVPPLLERASAADPVRILSVGCATGEEPYSIAMALRERFGEGAAPRLCISACDVDESALARAQAGVYGPFSFRALPGELADRYFTPAGRTRRQIAPELRRQVRFFPWNLFGAADPPALSPQDLIFFRNVSIYFDAQTRHAAMARLRALLKPGGHLIVGAAETLANDFGLLRLHARDGVFLFAAGASPGDIPGTAACLTAVAPPPAVADRGPPRPRAPVAPWSPAVPVGGGEAPEGAAEAYGRALALARAERFEAALERLAPLSARADAPAPWLTLQAYLHLERGETELAAAAAGRALQRDPWFADALLLEARCARLQGDPERAIRALRRVIYDNPGCWRAHYQLAEVYRGQGEGAQARREYRIVLRQLADEGRALPGVGELPSLPAASDVRFLCEARLAGLAAAA